MDQYETREVRVCTVGVVGENWSEKSEPEDVDPWEM